MDLTPLELFRFRCVLRRERILRRIRRRKTLLGSIHRELIRRGLSGEIDAANFAALKDVQKFTPRNEPLRRMAENRPPDPSPYLGDESWD